MLFTTHLSVLIDWITPLMLNASAAGGGLIVLLGGRDAITATVLKMSSRAKVMDTAVR